MNIEDLYNKYIDEPNQKRKSIDKNIRLKYAKIEESWLVYWLVALSVPTILFALYFLISIEIYNLAGIGIFWVIGSAFYYQYKSRKC